ncbi:MAG: type II toxin-antitoxin system RatA family toxin [Burkholderiales bacterium]|jgi:ribosome-associated toxin RatA of RatAB toxin-antitoxin module
MNSVTRSALVPFSAQQMFDLVEGVEQYPQFLPWCSGTAVSHRDPAVTQATIHINYRGIKQSFSTENHKQPPERMTLQLVEGPFRMLDGEWLFTALGAEACKVDFRLSYEFSSTLLEKLVGPVFGHIAGTMVDAFLKRADMVYAEP